VVLIMTNPTKDTYNKFSKEYAEKFRNFLMTEYINRVFDDWRGDNPRVLELGCGAGRDAEEICQRTSNYTGIDISEGLLEIAKQKKIANAKFSRQSIKDYGFTENFDIVFAVASLLHVNEEDFAQVLQRVHKILAKRGLFHITVKHGKYKGEELVKDKYGERIFYFYRLSDIKRMAEGYEVVSEDQVTVGKTEWINILLRKL